jgi:hypothetical protein
VLLLRGRQVGSRLADGGRRGFGLPSGLLQCASTNSKQSHTDSETYKGTEQVPQHTTLGLVTVLEVAC